MRSRLILFICLLTLAAFLPVNAGSEKLSDKEYYNKVRGAWLGKCIGGALGMPLEGWKYSDIEKKYPKLTDYVGYFDYSLGGWSGMLKTVNIPKDNQWYSMMVRMRVPEFDTKNLHASPIIGMSLEHSTVPMTWEMRNIKIVRPGKGLPFNNDVWQTVLGSYWSGENQVSFFFNGERSWLKMFSGVGQKLDLKPGDDVLISFDAKWLTGDNQIGFAFDYLTNNPRKGFGADDDTSYEIVGLHALETYGPDLSCTQIGKEWVDHVPSFLPIYLAEGLAMERMKSGIVPPASGEHPIGEAIGGQMKGEIWGLISPMRPDLASEYARRDGVVAHCKNGVYGEQYVSVMISSAFKEKNPLKLVKTGLSYIPQDSKYAEIVKGVLDKYEKKVDWREIRNELKEKYPSMCDPVYPEAGIITIALLYGEGDFEKTINIAAFCGSDTDCNTATVGSIIGCIIGADKIPGKWKAPIGDEFRSFAIGYENWKISELSRRICDMGRKTLKHHGSGVKFSADI
ncbi:MAG: ADP-ribosylglycohydrolase family protein [Armatimonadota bacterium]